VNAFDDLTRRHARQAQANASSAELAQSSETNRTLQAALREANSIVERAEAQVSALQEQRASVAHELLAFEADLKSQRAESKRFGVQLQLLKSEQQTVAARTAGEVAQLESERRAVKVQLVATERDLEEARNAYAELDIWRETHHCDS